MSSRFLDAAARQVLRRYPAALVGGTRIALGNHDGFSGACLWRLEAGPATLCLRAWPPGNPSSQRLDSIHSCLGMARSAGLTFIPAIVATADGKTWLEHAGRLWEVTTWMPGRADFHECPSVARLEAAMAALAALHAAWSGQESRGPCPAVRRRLDLARQWQSLQEAGWDASRLVTPDDPVQPWVARAWRILSKRVPDVPFQLAAWTARHFPLQPCLCDIWHDHVLFAGDAVSGIIDFGSIKTDHVAVDLARLLGSIAGADASLWQRGLRAYERSRPLSAEEEALVAALDETGTVLGAANWLMWLYHDHKQFENRPAVARRLAELVQRLERGR